MIVSRWDTERVGNVGNMSIVPSRWDTERVGIIFMVFSIVHPLGLNHSLPTRPTAVELRYGTDSRLLLPPLLLEERAGERRPFSAAAGHSMAVDPHSSPYRKD